MSSDIEKWPPPNDPVAFESLCLDLWQEIWGPKCGAQKNGRSGQPQAGVDVFGRDGEQWVGVQCKQKDDLVRSKLTVAELAVEVEKARRFNPSLSLFIVATTGPRDKAVQERARQITASGFPVEVWSWDDIWRELYGRPDLLRRIGPDYWPMIYGKQKWWLGYVVASFMALIVSLLFLRLLRSPSFEILRSLFLENSGIPWIPVSASAIILVAVGVQFYSGETLDQPTLRKLFAVLLLGLLVGSGILHWLYTSHVVLLGSREDYVLVGWSRLPECKCGKRIPNDECVEGLGVDIGACWGETSIESVRTCFNLVVLLEACGIGAFLGLIVRQGTALWQRAKEK